MSRREDAERREAAREVARRQMVETVRRHGREAAGGEAQLALDERVLEALGRVPRHRFVPDDARDLAYGDYPLSIGWGQTVSQPYVVACMTSLLRAEQGDRVLEIGTGSGYQAAVLCELGLKVYGIEVVPELAAAAQARLADLGYRDVQVRCGDGNAGWPEEAPFAGIVVTAAAPAVPPRLVEQLGRGARLVVPVGPQHDVQWLTVVERDARGELSTRELLGVRFVPLVSR